MRIEFAEHSITVTRETGDPKFYGVRSAAGESALLYYIKKALNALGHDLIKKRMHKDGHMVSEYQQYLRSRKASGDPHKDIAIWNGRFQIDGAEVAWNTDGAVTFLVEREIFTTV